jgi:hypothetical protein
MKSVKLLFILTALVFALTGCLEAEAQNTAPSAQPGADTAPDTEIIVEDDNNSVPAPETDEVAQEANAPDDDWQTEFDLAGRNLTDTGESTYFILIPGYQTVLESEDARLTVTVLDETKEIDGVTTRVVEEREEEAGELVEVSRNFFAIDADTGDVFYFGEEVDMYENGEISSHDGAWLAGENGNQPGLIMPANPEVGMKYYQEIAPDVAMDRAEVVKTDAVFESPAGSFENALVTEESTPLEPGVTEYKTYAPGIGMVQDEDLVLVSHGNQ